MPKDTVTANARLFLPNEVILGSISIKDGLIVDITSAASVPAGAIDADGDDIGPGLVELCTDNLERHLTPRTKVSWPHRPAIV